MYRPGPVKLAAFIVGDQATGEDVVQDVFTRLHQRWGMLADPGDPLSYLRTAVVNGCRSAIRRRGRAETHRARRCPPRNRRCCPRTGSRCWPRWPGSPGRRREVLVLRFYAGLSEAEIAATLGISAGTVKSTAARGPRSRTEGDPMIRQEETTETADRLTDAPRPGRASTSSG